VIKRGISIDPVPFANRLLLLQRHLRMNIHLV
jgi:hypothetical protein